MPSYKLHYFDVRARAEVARILMAYGGIDFEDIRYTGEEWAKVKPTAVFGQLPMLEVDGKKFCQSHAIGRFLAKKVGLHGKTDLDEIKIDMIIGCIEDFIQPQISCKFEKDEKLKEEKRKAVNDSLEEKLKMFEALLEGDFFASNQLSWADISFAEGLLFSTCLGFTLPMDKVPKLAALKDKVNNDPKIAPWIAKRPESSL